LLKRYFRQFLGLLMGFATLQVSAQTLPVSAGTSPAAVSDLSFSPAEVACAHPFGFSAGQQLEYQLLDARGKPTGKLLQSCVLAKM
jgi:hypothetical protein